MKNQNTGNKNTGDLNTGNWNTGDLNAGSWNTGDLNTGNCNTGDWNTGHSNIGHRNTGDWNTGNWNTGNCNTGDWNTGHRNTGDRNTGNWNTGNCNTGYCNTVTPENILVFNKPCTRAEWINADKPSWMFAKLTQWVFASEMTDKEKSAYPSYVTTGGYLKAHSSLKDAYVEAWEKASDEDRALTRQLPNFDEEVFAEVFGFNPWKHEIGFNPCKHEKRSVTLELTDDQLAKVKAVLGEE